MQQQQQSCTIIASLDSQHCFNTGFQEEHQIWGTHCGAEELCFCVAPYIP